MAWFASGNFERNLELAEDIRRLAAEVGCTSSQLALAWLLAQGPDVFPIPGTDRVTYVEENVGSFFVELDDEQLQRIDEICPRGHAAGETQGSTPATSINQTPKPSAAASPSASERPAKRGDLT
jgi:aryl-alcohol dehydrogenase-like predicted oxidoreductase